MICRLCVIESKNLLNIFHSNDMRFNIAETIAKHFGFEPTENDPITSSICVPCWTRIEDFHSYYLDIEDAQRKFVKMYLQIDIKQDDPKFDMVEIKNELNAVEFLPAWSPRLSEIEDTTITSLKEELKHEDIFDNDDWIHCESSNDSELPLNELIRTKDRLKNCIPSSKESQIDTKTTRKTRIKSKIKEEKPPPKKRERKRKVVKNNEEFSKKIAEVKPNRVSPHAKSKEYDQEIAERTKLKCDICADEFTKFAEMQRHYRSAHNTRGYMVCCDKRFYKRHIFLNHLLKHVDPDRLKCNVCKRSYANLRALQYHMLTYHEADNPFQCDQCPKSYPKQYMLNVHNKLHKMKSTKENRCEDCGKNYSTGYALQHHIRYMHDNAFIRMCDICAKVLRNKQLFEKHQLLHKNISSDEPRQQCQQCGMWLKNAYRLKLHTKKHKEAENEHICKICGKSSPNVSALKSHIRYVHSAKRLHKCSFCDKAFKNHLSLKEHITTHTGGTLYTCPHCPKTFNSNANMHSHRKKKHPKEWEEARKIRNQSVVYQANNDEIYSMAAAAVAAGIDDD